MRQFVFWIACVWFYSSLERFRYSEYKRPSTSSSWCLNNPLIRSSFGSRCGFLLSLHLHLSHKLPGVTRSKNSCSRQMLPWVYSCSSLQSSTSKRLRLKIRSAVSFYWYCTTSWFFSSYSQLSTSLNWIRWQWLWDNLGSTPILRRNKKRQSLKRKKLEIWLRPSLDSWSGYSFHATLVRLCYT